jgi:hypothetical protein
MHDAAPGGLSPNGLTHDSLSSRGLPGARRGGQPDDEPLRSGSPQNGLPRNEPSYGGPAQNGLPREGSSDDGLPGAPRDGRPQDEPLRGGPAQNGFPLDDPPRGEPPRSGLPGDSRQTGPHDGPPSRGASNGLPAGALPHDALSGGAHDALSGGAARGDLHRNSRADNGLPGSGLPHNGLSQNGALPDGLSHGDAPQNGLPPGGLSRIDGLRKGMPQGGPPHHELPQTGLPQGGVAPVGPHGDRSAGFPPDLLNAPVSPPRIGGPHEAPGGTSASYPPQGPPGQFGQARGRPGEYPAAGQDQPAPYGFAAGAPEPYGGPSAAGAQDRYGGPSMAAAPEPHGELPAAGALQPYGSPSANDQPPQPISVSLTDAVRDAHAEGFGFGESVVRDAPALWLEAVLARKPRMPSDLEARLLQGSSLPIDSLLHDEVRAALRRGFWDALERTRR